MIQSLVDKSIVRQFNFSLLQQLKNLIIEWHINGIIVLENDDDERQNGYKDTKRDSGRYYL